MKLLIYDNNVTYVYFPVDKGTIGMLCIFEYIFPLTPKSYRKLYWKN